MKKSLDWWNMKHHKYATEDWVNKPSLFASWAINYFPKTGEILELGAGHGQDSRYFAERGFSVTSTDFSDSALEYNKNKIPENLINKITLAKVDLSKPLPFEPESFDIVYSHLSIHYFNDSVTDKIFSEIYRVLKPNGIVAILVNSVNDPEYGLGQELGPDYFELTPGDIKHFFSQKYMAEKAKKFETMILDDHGTTHKDNAKGVTHLIRFIGIKNY